MTFEDMSEIEKAVRIILKAVGEDPDREGLVDTPSRVARAYKELLAGYSEEPTKLIARNFSGERYDEIVALNGIQFWSMCEHHMLPFSGTVDLAYVPSDRIIGLSKLARVVHIYARRLQVQERMTNQIAAALMEVPGCKGAAVVVHGQHLCMMARGVAEPNATMVTSAMLGCFRDDQKARGEVLGLLGLH
jgi:GTP cyclohydrolase I